MKQNIKIILASGSPRRRELLEQEGLEFSILVSDVDESTDITEPDKVVEELSRRKCIASVKEYIKTTGNKEDVLVVSADTVVALDGRVIGKPKDEKEALDILMSLSGKTHDV